MVTTTLHHAQTIDLSMSIDEARILLFQLSQHLKEGDGPCVICALCQVLETVILRATAH